MGEDLCLDTAYTRTLEEGSHILKIEDIQQTKLVEIGWRFNQSYYGGHIGAQMIMHCLANRYKSGWGPWLDIIAKVPQFMAENELPELTFPNQWDGNFVKVLHLVSGVFDGSIPDLSKGALYWADLNRIERPWFKSRIVDPIKENGQREHPIVATINSLTFFR